MDIITGIGMTLIGVGIGGVFSAYVLYKEMMHEIEIMEMQNKNIHKLWEKYNNKLHAVREWCHQGHKVQVRGKNGKMGKKEFVRVLLDKHLKDTGHGSL